MIVAELAYVRDGGDGEEPLRVCEGLAELGAGASSISDRNPKQRRRRRDGGDGEEMVVVMVVKKRDGGDSEEPRRVCERLAELGAGASSVFDSARYSTTISSFSISMIIS
ncbi:Uncharacterized protein Rs2_26896 [Raphanus sativus]|nr:Uncharacterized protein Rs2_26896 [Raphanus sativus]